ncbi:MAG: hypothetical protein M3O91_01045 [Chloroflexota bacterium]|nr:hypothetical protein [Chloroflexota bacterium]
MSGVIRALVVGIGKPATGMPRRCGKSDARSAFAPLARPGEVLQVALSYADG